MTITNIESDPAQRTLAGLFSPNELMTELGFPNPAGLHVLDLGTTEATTHLGALSTLGIASITCIGVRNTDTAVRIHDTFSAEGTLRRLEMGNPRSFSDPALPPEQFDLVVAADVSVGQEERAVAVGRRHLTPGGTLLVTGGNVGMFSRVSVVEAAMRRANLRPRSERVFSAGSTAVQGYNLVTVGKLDA